MKSWLYFYSQEPFDNQGLELTLAQIAAMTHNIHRAKNSPRARPDEYLHGKRWRVDVEEQDSFQIMKQAILSELTPVRKDN